VDEVTVLLKGRVMFKKRICKRFGIKIYKLCNMSSYTYAIHMTHEMIWIYTWERAGTMQHRWWQLHMWNWKDEL